jgi:hypothetical protein
MSNQTKIMNIINLLIRTLTLQLLFMGFVTLKAQKNLPEGRTLQPEREKTVETSVLPEIPNFDGTYQIILKSDRSIFLHSEIFERIERSRKDDEDYILILAIDCEVYIPSKNKIQSKTFSPFVTAFVKR